MTSQEITMYCMCITPFKKDDTLDEDGPGRMSAGW